MVNETDFMTALRIGAERAGIALPKWEEKRARPSRNGQNSGKRMGKPSNSIEEQLTALAALPDEERGKRLRALFEDLARLDDFQVTDYRSKITSHLKLGKREFDRLLKVARATVTASDDDHREIIEGKYPILSMALDFFDDIGVVSVPLAEQDQTSVTYRPYLITSTRQILPIPETQIATIGSSKILLRDHPAGLSSNSRWSYPHIQEFLKGYTPNAVEVLRRVESLFTKYIDFEKRHTAIILALWTIGTYLYPLFETYPYLALHGPKGSGKSKTIALTEKLAFNMRVSSSISASSLFRIVETTRGTLGIDEGERLAHRNDPVAGDLRLLLNSGYKRGSPALRVEGDADHREVKEFEVYAPKVIASIAGLEDVLESRCIKIAMLRTRDERGNLAVSERAEDWAAARHNLYSFALTAFKAIRGLYENDSALQILANRDNELWLPILAIAKFIEQSGEAGLIEVVTDFARTATSESEGNRLSDRDQAFILALVKLTRNKGLEEFTPKEVLNAMSQFLEADEHSTVTSQWVGFAFKRFGFTRQRKTKGSTYPVKESGALDLAARYEVNVPKENI